VAERLPINVTLSVLPDRLPSRVETTAYYVACEAMSNAARHAQASRVAVAVEQETDTVRMVVRDDGVGGARVGSGSGLTGIADRVSAIGGTLDIDSEEGAGTVIKVVLPCE
jgi:signal transduction histidine kinase